MYNCGLFNPVFFGFSETQYSSLARSELGHQKDFKGNGVANERPAAKHQIGSVTNGIARSEASLTKPSQAAIIGNSKNSENPKILLSLENGTHQSKDETM